jgi:hypothetical protein
MDWLKVKVRSAQPRPGEGNSQVGFRWISHGRSDGNVSVLASFAVTDVQAGWLFAAVDILNLDADRLAHAQTAVIHQPQTGAKARLLDGVEQLLDFGARQDQRQHFRFGHTHLAEHRPAADLEAFNEEGEQRLFGHLHGAGLVVFVLAQKQEVFPHLVFGEGGRVTLKVLGQLTDVAHILLLGRPAVVFKLDELFKLHDRGIVRYYHRGRGCP